MIKPTELRINNSVIIEDKVRGNYVYEITAHDLEEMESFEYDYKQNGVLPIPLTPEILEKCGFKRNGKQWKHPEDSAGIFVDEAGNKKRYQPLTIDKFISGYYVETYYGGIEIKSVHQLQNLYFALTGEELEIKEQIKL